MSIPSVPCLDLTPLPNAGDRELPSMLEAGWSRFRARGALAYDPEAIEVLEIPPLSFYFLPGREARPRSVPPADEPYRLSRPHRSCPFDGPEFLDEREVLRIRHGGRLYHLALNKYPVMRLHLLAIRPASEPPALLPQRLTGAEEIEDMLLLALHLGPPFRLFFNSNRGADGSSSGSSVNHWHFQIFPCFSEIVNRTPGIASRAGEVEYGRIPDWPAHHRLYRSAAPRKLAAAIWADVARIDAQDSAYNLELDPLPDGRLLGLFFPRAKIGDLALPEGGVLSGDFGGVELSGGVVIPHRRLFDWVRDHPREASDHVLFRMEAGTREPPKLSVP